MIQQLSRWVRRARRASRGRETPATGQARTDGGPEDGRPARDSQRSAVYSWERRLPGWPGPTLSLAECQELVGAVWAEYLSTPAPRVTDGRGRRSACYAPDSHQVRLPRAGRSTFIVLHEIAHGILSTTHPGAAYHGPEFARLYLNLLHGHAGVSLSRARSLAVHQRPRRVHFARLDDVPAPLPADERRVAGVLDDAGQPLLF